MVDTLGLTVPAELDGVRLDKALADMLGVSRSVARSLVERGVTVDGEMADPSRRVHRGSSVVTPAPPGRETLEPEEVDFGVLYEDEDVLVVDKPAGVVVHPGPGNRSGTLASGILHRYPEISGVGAGDRWGLVHRLDRDTSGALLVARTPEAFEILTSQLRERTVRREYVALVAGVLTPPTGTIDAPIGRDPQNPTRRAVTRDGKWARTHYRVVSNFPATDVALVSVTLETGRTHQIRVHLSAIGHPVVGDPVYGSGNDPLEVPRIFLHAETLAFRHPRSGEELVIESPLPPDLSMVLSSLRQIEGA